MINADCMINASTGGSRVDPEGGVSRWRGYAGGSPARRRGGRRAPRPAAPPELGEAALDLAPHAPDGDAEDTLAALHEVDHLVGGGALVDARTVAHQRDLRQVLDAPLAQVAHRDADLLQRHTGVEQPLHDLEHEDVAEAVEPLRTRARSRAHAGLHEPGAGPVVELAVGDARRAAGGRAAVTDVLVEDRQVLGEQQTLRRRRNAGRARHATRGLAGTAHAVLLSLRPRGEESCAAVPHTCGGTTPRALPFEP